MVYSAAIATSELQYFTIGQYAFSDLGYSNEKKKRLAADAISPLTNTRRHPWD